MNIFRPPNGSPGYYLPNGNRIGFPALSNRTPAVLWCQSNIDNITHSAFDQKIDMQGVFFFKQMIMYNILCDWVFFQSFRIRLWLLHVLTEHRCSVRISHLRFCVKYCSIRSHWIAKNTSANRRYWPCHTIFQWYFKCNTFHNSDYFYWRNIHSEI